MAEQIDLQTIVGLTKNFTGAEIEGVVKSAKSFAISRTIDCYQTKNQY
jgi:vesicle-fusing ATPase